MPSGLAGRSYINRVRECGNCDWTGLSDGALDAHQRAWHPELRRDQVERNIERLHALGVPADALAPVKAWLADQETT